MGLGTNSPVTIGWDNIVDPQLLADLLNTQMQCVGVELLACHVSEDGSGQVHQTSSLVVSRVTPSVALLSLLGAVGVQLCR